MVRWGYGNCASGRVVCGGGGDGEFCVLSGVEGASHGDGEEEGGEVEVVGVPKVWEEVGVV